MSLKSATNFSGGVSRADLASQIVAEPSLVAWFSSRASDAQATGGLVDVLSDRAGGASEMLGAGASRPSVVANQFGALSGIVFDGTDDALGLDGAFDRSQLFTIAAVMRASDGALCSSFTSISQQTTLLVQADQIAFNHGLGQAVASYENGERVLVVASFSPYRVALRVGGGQSLFSSTDGNGGTATFCMGALNQAGTASLNGAVAEFWLFQNELLNDAAFDILDVVRSYVAAIYPDVAI